MGKAEDYNKAELVAGRLTIEAITELVRGYQDVTGLPVDGMYGPRTRAKVERDLGDDNGRDANAPFLHNPLPVLAGNRRAQVTSGHHSVNPDRPNHNGCDWFYRWQTGDVPAFVGDKGAAGTIDGHPKWVVPSGVYAIAAAPGVIQIAGNSKTGYRCWIDHQNGWRTGYFHLLNLVVHVGDVVRTGDALGLVGDNPADHDGRHLHFELSPVERYAPVDPEPWLVK